MAIFSAASIAKAGLATITPGWLRDTLGVRSLETDATVGLSLNLKTLPSDAGPGVELPKESNAKSRSSLVMEILLRTTVLS